MRLSGDDLLADYFEVYLNGKINYECKMADEEKGLCEVFLNVFKCKVLKGKVELKPKEKLWNFLCESKKDL